MKFNDVQTLESLLKNLNEYGASAGAPTYNAGGTSSQKSVTVQTPSPSTQKPPSPTTTGIKPKQPANVVPVKAKDLDDGTEFKDEAGNVVGTVTSKVGRTPQRSKVVVELPDGTPELYSPDVEVMVDEDISHDILNKITKRTASKKNSISKKIKRLSRQRLGEVTKELFEINFNQKSIVSNALDLPIRCGFEAETIWNDYSDRSGSSEDVEELSWYDVQQQLYVSSSDEDSVNEGFAEYIRENLVSDYLEDAIDNAVEEERDNDQSYIDFMEGGNGPSEDAVQEYKENYKDEDPIEYQNREEDGWETINWTREYVDEEYGDEFMDYMRERVQEDGEVYNVAYTEAEENTSIDEWISNEYYGMSAFLDDYGIDYSEMTATDSGLEDVRDDFSQWQRKSSFNDEHIETGEYGDTYTDGWAIETDSSIEGDGAGAEIISPVYESPRQMLEELRSMFEFFSKDVNVETNHSTGLHVTMSWNGEAGGYDGSNHAEANKVKMAVLLGDQYLLSTFGRLRNSYTKSQYQNVKIAAQKVKAGDLSSLETLQDMLGAGISNDKFTSINFKSEKDKNSGYNLVEFRIAGGDDYHTDIEKVVKAVVRYATVMEAGHTEKFQQDYSDSIFKVINNAGKIDPELQAKTDRLDLVNVPLVDTFKSMLSKDNYFDGLSEITSAYRLKYEHEENLKEASSRELSDAQDYYIKAMGRLAVDVHKEQHRSPINAKTIRIMRVSTADFYLDENEITPLVLSKMARMNIPTQNDRADQQFSVIKSGIDKLFKKNILVTPSFMNSPNAEKVVKGVWNALHTGNWSKEENEQLIKQLIELNFGEGFDPNDLEAQNMRASLQIALAKREFNDFYQTMTQSGYNSPTPAVKVGNPYYKKQFSDLTKWLGTYDSYDEPVSPSYNRNIHSDDSYEENYLNTYIMKLRKRFKHLEEIKDDNYKFYLDSVQEVAKLTKALLPAMTPVPNESSDFRDGSDFLAFGDYTIERLQKTISAVNGGQGDDPFGGTLIFQFGETITDQLRSVMGAYFLEQSRSDGIESNQAKNVIKNRWKAIKTWMSGFDKLSQKAGFDSQAGEIADKQNIGKREKAFKQDLQDRPPAKINIPAYSVVVMHNQMYSDIEQAEGQQAKLVQLAKYKSAFNEKLNSAGFWVIPDAHWNQADEAWNVQSLLNTIKDSPLGQSQQWRFQGSKAVLKKFFMTYNKSFQDLRGDADNYLAFNVNRRSEHMPSESPLLRTLKSAGIEITQEGNSKEPTVEPLVPHADLQHPEQGTPFNRATAAADGVGDDLTNYTAPDEPGDSVDSADINTNPDQESALDTSYEIARGNHILFNNMMANGMNAYMIRGQVNDLVGFLNNSGNPLELKNAVLLAITRNKEAGEVALTYDQALNLGLVANGGWQGNNESVLNTFGNLTLSEQLLKLENIQPTKINKVHSKLLERKLQRAELKTPERIQAFADKLSAGAEFDLAGYTGKIVLDSEMASAFYNAETASQLPSKLRTADGEIIAYSALEKTAEFGARSADADSDAPIKVSNKGEVAEGILGCATFARLLVRPSALITATDIENVIKRLPKDAPDKGGWHELTLTAQEVDNPIADFFTLTLNLKSDTYQDFIDPKKWGVMQQITGGVSDYVNDNLEKYTNYFQANGKVDTVKVIADGVTGETDTKVDVFLTHSLDGGPEKTLQHFDMSVKVGSTKQMGQVGGGKQTEPLNVRYVILKEMFDRFNVDLTPIENQFVTADSVEQGYKIAYTEATKQLNSHLTSEEQEQDFLVQLLESIKFFATLNDDRVKLVQFTDLKAGGYYVLDFKKLDRMFDKDKVDLEAKMIETAKHPKITIFNKVTGKDFLSVRMYQNGKGYIRNYIEKEKGLVDLLKVRGSGMRKKVESVQEQSSFGISLHNQHKVSDILDYLSGVKNIQNINSTELSRDIQSRFGLQAYEARYVISLWQTQRSTLKSSYNPVKEGAVPNNDTVRKLREILSKPILTGDLKAQMQAYICIPDPSMLRDFRSARASYGDNHDLRSLVKSYAKIKLHKKVQAKIK